MSLDVYTEPVGVECGVLIILVATGGTEHTAIDTIRTSSSLRYVLLVHHESDNSLPATPGDKPVLKSILSVSVVVVMLGQAGGRVSALMKAYSALNRIRGNIILVLGSPLPWLVYPPGVEDVVREVWSNI